LCFFITPEEKKEEYSLWYFSSSGFISTENRDGQGIAKVPADLFVKVHRRRRRRRRRTACGKF
jgi:hypothetical protein